MTPPVLFMIFNRKNISLVSLARIREAKPSQIFIAADGPREKTTGEADRCNQTREAVLQGIDWDCDVRTLFREKNLGCKRAVSEAITWFFDSVEAGIIIEDDCVVSQSFFVFCEELLARYKDDNRILSISANCFQPKGTITNASYYFSKYQHCWGWASWKRAWNLYEKDMKAWPDFKKNNGLASYSDGCRVFINHFTKIFDDVHKGIVDTWDFQWMFTGLKNGMVSIIPAINMCTNTGCGQNATHTSNANEWTATLPALEMNFPLKHPATVERNVKADRWSDIHLWHIRRLQPIIHLLSRNAALRFIYHKLYIPLLRRHPT